MISIVPRFGLLALVLGLAASHPLLTHPVWLQFKITHGKTYNNEIEESLRHTIFFSNLMKVEEHNKRFDEGLTTFKLKMNQFGDLTEEEFRQMFNVANTEKKPEDKDDDIIEFARQEPSVPLPDSVDWRTKGAVTHVKNQGQCASCWAFSATGALEGQLFIKKNISAVLSEQNLMDCSHEEGNKGCSGGFPEVGFRHVAKEGIDTEDEYPYRARNGQCAFKKESAYLSGLRIARVAIDEKVLQVAVAEIGPISVSIDARNQTFHLYSSGLYYEEACKAEGEYLEHAVLVVGYGTENGTDYWLVKNSWGLVWGELGYMKMSRNRNNNCGIVSSASFPVV